MDNITPFDGKHIFLKGRDRTADIIAYSEQDSIIHIKFRNGAIYSYNKDNVRIQNPTESEKAPQIRFEYLKEIAAIIGLNTEFKYNILHTQYEQLNPNKPETILTSYLKQSLPERNKEINSIQEAEIICPFSFNLSQKAAIAKALDNPLSQIEGPPGTGKTQTILNIMANLILRDKNMAIISSNNSATQNILEKLQKEHLDFIAAPLGNHENQERFWRVINSKTPPNLKKWELAAKARAEKLAALRKKDAELSAMLHKKNTLAKLKPELTILELEYKHFQLYKPIELKALYQNYFIKNSAKSSIALKLWLQCEFYAKRNKKPGFFRQYLNRFLYGIKLQYFYKLPTAEQITLCQALFYETKIAELKAHITTLTEDLSRFNFSAEMNIYRTLSLHIFLDKLAKKYTASNIDKQIVEKLRTNSKIFLAQFPVILSTAYSLRNCFNKPVMYDYVIIDEASQLDIVCGALSLSCAKNAVIVGDNKQLSHIVDSQCARKTDTVFSRFSLSEAWRYKTHNLQDSLAALFPTMPRTLLREHYRCHPQIIEFCNRRFYENKLIIFTEATVKSPLIIYKTVAGNHARGHINQRQIDVIQNEILPQQINTSCNGNSIGIITPYRKQADALQAAFSQTAIEADTVDKFQGRERDIIILSTTDNQISAFANQPNRLNVAISRAVHKLIIVLNGDTKLDNTLIGDLIHYIHYNNIQVIQSEIHSIFDYLYKAYNYQRHIFLSKRERISVYDSENLSYALIKNIIQKPHYASLDIAAHISLKNIITDTYGLTEAEKHYAENIWTHIDFIIFDKFSKIPKLAVEIDGFAFHQEGTRQAERDAMKNSILAKKHLPLIRLKTHESNEEQKLIHALNAALNL